MALSLDDDEIASRLDRAWKYSFGQEPAAKLMNKGSNELSSKGHFHFRSETITARQETQGIISYQVDLRIEGGRCTYTVHQFIHRGNTTTRTGGIHFGRIMNGLLPGRKVRRLGRRNTERIHADMKIQLKARFDKVLALLKQQLELAD